MPEQEPENNQVQTNDQVRQPPHRQQQRQEQQADGWSSFLNSLMRGLFIYFLIQFFMKSTTNNTSVNNVQQNVFQVAYPFGTPLKVEAYWSLDSGRHLNNDLIFAREFSYGQMEEEEKPIEIPLQQFHQKNQTIYLHLFLIHLPTQQRFKQVHSLTKFMAPPQQFKNLLSQKEEKELSEKEIKWFPHFHSNLTLNLITDQQPLQLTPFIQPHLRLLNETHHVPILFYNTIWQFKEDFQRIYPDNQTLPLYLKWTPLSQWYFQLMKQLDFSFGQQQQTMGVSEKEVEQIKRMFFETNPYFLGLTMFISLLHSVFDFLAFKNDVQFWRNVEHLEGLSIRTLFLNVFFQTIIFLYLWDNETSWLILISTFVGLLIEAWKIQKMISFKVDLEQKSFFGLLPFKIGYQEKKQKSELRKKTDEYDELAFKYLSIVCFPLLVGYSIYSLIYEQHKSLYSYIIGVAVGFVYTFGFISMTPQLFINYKLKSVAHMPWKTFMYKALNTFVDDLFAFIIKMPTLHRLACFRDDLIFLIYLYQRWIYPMDPNRPNEYGQVIAKTKEAEEEEKPKQE